MFDVFGVLFCCYYWFILEDNGCCEVFHELVELDESLFDLLDIIVAGADCAEDGGGCCCAVGFELRTCQ